MDREPFVMHFGFMIDGFLVHGGVTIMVSDDKKAGWAICSPFDNFNRKQGLIRASERLKTAPVSLEDYNPAWNYNDKTNYVSTLAEHLVRLFGGEKWKEAVDVVPRKMKFFKVLSEQDLEEMFNLIQEHQPEPPKKQTFKEKFSHMFGG